MSQSTIYALYCLFALGGIALICLMPGGERRRRTLGIFLGVAAVVGLMALLAVQRQVADNPRTLFYAFSVIALIAGVRVITHPKPVYSAIYFVLVVVATAAILVLQSAEFLAVALIIIYAGAILVTYLFVIMLAQQPTATLYDQNAREPMAAVVVGFLLVAVIAGHVGQPAIGAKTGSQLTLASDAGASNDSEPGVSNTLSLGALLFTQYVAVVELAGILLLVSMAGAIALSRKRIESDVQWPRRPLGQIGKEVEPF
jgi:NADH-quinone oxidoreductase subunit J